MIINKENLNSLTPSSSYKYYLSAEERKDLFFDTIPAIESTLPDDGIRVLVIPSKSELANYVRSVETEKFPTVPEFEKPYEEQSKFIMVLQDPEEGVYIDRPAHVFRVQTVNSKNNIAKTPTGLPTFDDVLSLGKVTEKQLLDYYEASSLKELGELYVNVDTNIAIDGVRFSLRKPYSAIGYRALFELLDHYQHEGVQYRGVVAYQNVEAMQSIGYMGVVSTPLIGDETISVKDEDKLITGSSSEALYFPLTIESTPYSHIKTEIPEHNRRVFSDPEYAKSVSRIAGMIACKTIYVAVLS